MAEKTEKKSGGGQIIKLALVLFAVSAIMALALGLIYEVTKDTIAMRAAETTKNAYANVLPADDYAEQADFENDAPSPSSASPPPAASRPATSPRPRSPAPRA
ncbi:MAG: hypothetical protein ACLU0Z_06795 [Oscillospiraceae bacterium]